MSKDISEENSRAATASDAAWRKAGGVLSMRGFGVTVVRFAIIGGFLLLWEIASGRWIEPFLISSPSRILSSLITGFLRRRLDPTHLGHVPRNRHWISCRRDFRHRLGLLVRAQPAACRNF